MSITDELRTLEVHDGRLSMWYDRLLAIADRIDAAHKQAVDKAHADGERNGLQQARSASEDYRRGYEAGKADGFDEGFASADDWLAEHEGEMAEHGWVELPKDADGVPIRVGDDVTTNYDHGIVTSIKLADDGWWVYVGGAGMRPDKYLHYHAPTTEDVLREMLAEVGDGGVYAEDVLVAKYAERLQLKEEDA